MSQVCVAIRGNSGWRLLPKCSASRDSARAFRVFMSARCPPAMVSEHEVVQAVRKAAGSSMSPPHTWAIRAESAVPPRWMAGSQRPPGNLQRAGLMARGRMRQMREFAALDHALRFPGSGRRTCRLLGAVSGCDELAQPAP